MINWFLAIRPCKRNVKQFFLRRWFCVLVEQPFAIQSDEQKDGLDVQRKMLLTFATKWINRTIIAFWRGQCLAFHPIKVSILASNEPETGNKKLFQFKQTAILFSFFLPSLMFQNSQVVEIFSRVVFSLQMRFMFLLN